MSIAKFHVKYPRPARFSGQYFDTSWDYLNSLLAIPDNQLAPSYYYNLLSVYAMSGTYEERAYFLPHAFRYLIAHEDSAFELITTIVRFSSHFKDRLEQDKLAYVVQECLREVLAFLTREFKVSHSLNGSPANLAGRRIYHFDHVRNSDAVAQATHDLVEFGSFVQVAEDFVDSLAHHDDDPIKAAWFLEYACDQYARHQGAYPPTDHEPIKALIHDTMLLRLAAEVVSEKLAPDEPVRTYWRDTFQALNIDWAVPLPDPKERKKLAYPRELKSYMDKEGRLTEWPSPRNKKNLQRLVLEYLASKFEFDRNYTEREVNAILNQFHTFKDHALLRRELYDKRYFDRKLDGTAYWRTIPPESGTE